MGCSPSRSTGDPDVYWVSAAGDSDPGLVAYAPQADSTTFVRTGFRGHDAAQFPLRPNEVALFGRRPGTQSAIVDIESGKVVRRFGARPGHAFQGHGFFTRDGERLITVEASLTSAAGRLVVRDARTCAPTDDYDTFGIGPHEALLMADARTVVVANGGLLTRPDTGREVLNLETMDSTLTYLDLATGDLLEQVRLDEPKASIRHLDATVDGRVVMGVQLQRAAMDHGDPVALAAVHRRGGAPRFFEGAEIFTAMHDYVGSVAVSTPLGIAALSSPRGDLCGLWRLDDGAFVGHHELIDASGLTTTPDGSGFILSSSMGEVRTLSGDASEDRGARRDVGVRWDNHLVAVSTRVREELT